PDRESAQPRLWRHGRSSQHVLRGHDSPVQSRRCRLYYRLVSTLGPGVYFLAGRSRVSIRTSGESRVSRSASSSPASLSSSIVIGSSRSSRKIALVVSSVSRVRTTWRQFHLRQVTPASSRQITSPGAGCPSASSDASSPLARTRRGGP